jgi:hypothetical protein
MVTFYGEQVSALHKSVQDGTDATRLRAGEVLRSLVKDFILGPYVEELRINAQRAISKTPVTATGGLQWLTWLRG